MHIYFAYQEEKTAANYLAKQRSSVFLFWCISSRCCHLQFFSIQNSYYCSQDICPALLTDVISNEQFTCLSGVVSNGRVYYAKFQKTTPLQNYIVLFYMQKGESRTCIIPREEILNLWLCSFQWYIQK